MATLSCERIFSSSDFVDEGFNPPRWCEEGSCYTTLRRRNYDASDLVAASNSELTATTGSGGGASYGTVNEIIWHDPNNQTEHVFVSFEQLIPKGKSSPLSIDDYVTSSDKSKVLIFTNAQKVWRLCTRGAYWLLDFNEIDPETNKPCLIQLGGPGLKSDLMFATFSPDCNRVAYVRNNNIYVEDISLSLATALGTDQSPISDTIIQLTTDGSDNIINGTFDWVYEEEFSLYCGFKWSPNGESIAYWQLDQSDVSIVHLINNTDSLYPKLTPIHCKYNWVRNVIILKVIFLYDYFLLYQYTDPKCGETNPKVRIGIVTVPVTSTGAGDGHETRWIDLPGCPRDNYVVDMGYNNSNGQLVLQRLNRLQNTLHIYSVDPCTLGLTVVHTEHDSCWVDMRFQKLKWIHGGQNFFYFSERNGWRQLFIVSRCGLFDAVAVTPVGFDVESFCGYDTSSGLIYYTASPHDPIRRYLYSSVISVFADGSICASEPRRITPGSVDYEGTNGYSMSADARYAVHSFSSSQRPTTTTIVSLPDHEIITVLATNSRLLKMLEAINSPPIEYFRVPIPVEPPLTDKVGGKSKGLSDSILLDCYCIYPPNFDESKKYPAMFHVYGEPAAQIVRDQWGGKVVLWHRMLAQKGAVVICIDNRGCPAPRGREWRKCIYGKIGIVASSDQAEGVKQILATRPYLDASKVGIWGWSGGGSMSLNALFRYPDLYHTAVSVAPVPEMCLYDTLYQERYMGVPTDNPDGYKFGSPITFAKNMKETQNLLLVHGKKE